MILPSKELLNEVDPIGEACCEYHLMSMMKEWALKQEIVHSIDTYYDEIGIHTEIVGECKQSGESGCTLYSNISTDTIESTTDYCEWILKEISK